MLKVEVFSNKDDPNTLILFENVAGALTLTGEENTEEPLKVDVPFTVIFLSNVDGSKNAADDLNVAGDSNVEIPLIFKLPNKELFPFTFNFLDILRLSNELSPNTLNFPFNFVFLDSSIVNALLYPVPLLNPKLIDDPDLEYNCSPSLDVPIPELFCDIQGP